MEHGIELLARTTRVVFIMVVCFYLYNIIKNNINNIIELAFIWIIFLLISIYFIYNLYNIYLLLY